MDAYMRQERPDPLAGLKAKLVRAGVALMPPRKRPRTFKRPPERFTYPPQIPRAF